MRTAKIDGEKEREGKGGGKKPGERKGKEGKRRRK